MPKVWSPLRPLLRTSMDIKMQIMTLILTTSLIGQQSCENYFKYAALEAPSVTREAINITTRQTSFSEGETSRSEGE